MIKVRRVLSDKGFFYAFPFYIFHCEVQTLKRALYGANGIIAMMFALQIGSLCSFETRENVLPENDQRYDSFKTSFFPGGIPR